MSPLVNRKLRNLGTVPQGMLNPSGLVETIPDPSVQSTTRPAGTLLHPSAGYDSIRRGKNRFQGRGPTGGFREMEYAEDISGSGAALSIVPGDTASLESTEWLPESEDSMPEGAMIIADRKHEPGFAEMLHEGYNTMPDMGDRHPSRPRSHWKFSPFAVFHEDYQEHPLVTVIASVGLLALFNIVARDLERGFGSYRRTAQGPGTATAGAVGEGARTSGDIADDMSKTVEQATDKIGRAADDAVDKIGNAADSAVSKVEKAAS